MEGLEGPPPAPPLSGLSVVEVRAPELSLVEAMGEEGDLVSLRLARGCRCFTGWLNGDLVAYGWLSMGPEWIGEVGCLITPAAGEAYVWNCVTVARFRRLGVFHGLLARVAGCCRSEGLARLWIGSVPGGASSSVAGAGFTPALIVDSWAGAGIRVHLVRPVRSAAPLLVEGGRRALGVGTLSLRVAGTRRH